ncbi:Clavaminate synthase-like protein [Xylariomycetidae sp. FL2044]|nr:Clavaminate synthase-like protein [Xylariomycetidae sp. FL2044]
MASETLFKDIPPFPDDVPVASMSTIPLERLRRADGQTEEDVLTACKEVGFFLLDLRGDDLGNRLIHEIDQLFPVCQETTNLPDEVKEKHQNDIPRSFLGFKPLGQAKTEKDEPDRYEMFNIGQDGLMATVPLQSLPPSLYRHLPLIISYVRHCQEIVTILSVALARRLNLPENTFTALQSPTKPSGTMLRLLKSYASPEDADLRTSLIHHTDFGSITLLVNVVGGLQILQPGASPLDPSAWAWARPRPGCLIVNMGDAMTQWTGGILRSSMHRVTHAPGSQRFVDKYSIVYLARPERDAIMKKMVGPAPNASGGDHEDDHLTAWEWEVKKTMGMARAGYVSQAKQVKA